MSSSTKSEPFKRAESPKLESTMQANPNIKTATTHPPSKQASVPSSLLTTRSSHNHGQNTSRDSEISSTSGVSSRTPVHWTDLSTGSAKVTQERPRPLLSSSTKAEARKARHKSTADRQASTMGAAAFCVGKLACDGLVVGTRRGIFRY